MEILSNIKTKKIIATILKESWPSVAFKISMTKRDRIEVAWIDGPARDAVEHILDMFEGGRWNGMDDIYEYSNANCVFDRQIIVSTWRYCFAQRSISEARRAEAIEAYNATMHEPYNHWLAQDQHWLKKLLDEESTRFPRLASATFAKLDMVPDEMRFDEYFAEKERMEIGIELPTRAPLIQGRRSAL